MRALLRMLRFTLQGIVRNIWLAFVTTSIMVLTLLTINAVILLNVLVTSSLASMQERVRVEVYFVPETPDEVIKSVRGYLLGLSQVRDVQTVSSDDALEAFTKRHEHEPEILAALDEVGGNPFGDALRIQPHEPKDIHFILEAVESPEFSQYIKEKDYADYEQVIERMQALTQKIQGGGIALALFFGLISLLIVFNTIRVGIYTHREEISVMKLVGARDWFIRGPFLCEAAIYAGIATVIVAVMLWGFLGVLVEKSAFFAFFAELREGPRQFYETYGVEVFFVQWLGLATLSVLATMGAMRKFLKT